MDLWASSWKTKPTPTVKNEIIIIRYSEIALKAKYTRKIFENTLVDNIKNALKTKNILYEIKKQRGRIYLYTKKINTTLKILPKIFGIKTISPAIKTKSNIESITKKAVKILKEKIKEKQSFALRITREGKHEYTSQDVAVHVGNVIVKNTKAKVNLTKPDHTLYIEIRGEDAFLFEEKIPCQGGLPLGTQGTVLALVENQKTILAAWYLMRRGCTIVFIITNKSIEKTLRRFLEKWFIKPEIIYIENNKKLNETIKKIISEKQCEAIVTSHTIYDNDLINDIKQFKKQFKLPVLQPLITMSIDEIQKKSREIGLLK